MKPKFIRGLLRLVMLGFAGSASLNAVNACAQVPAPRPLEVPDLNLFSNGRVNDIVVQPDGGVIVGGKFTSINGIERRSLARFTPDGELDPLWNPGVDGEVFAIAIGADGWVYVTGAVSSIGGLPRGLARIHGEGAGAVDSSWNPGGTGRALAFDAAGALYVGGLFSHIGGLPRANIAKLSASGMGAADPLWNPGTNGMVRSLVVGADGSVYAGGAFTNAGGVPRARMAKFAGSANGAVDSAWNPSANAPVRKLVMDSSGMVYVGGEFTAIGGVDRSRLARLAGSGSGAVDSAWNPSPNGEVSALALDGNGFIFVGGSFSRVRGDPQWNVAKIRLDSGGSSYDWRPTPDRAVDALAVSDSGTVHVGGRFRRISDDTRLGFASLSTSEGEPISSRQDVEVPGTVDKIAVQPNGGVIVAGGFLKVGQQHERLGILRVHAGGALDLDWHPAREMMATAVIVDTQGSVFVAEGITISKLDGGGTGSADQNWRVTTNHGIAAMAFDGANALYVGGIFTSIGNWPGGYARKYAAKLSIADGAVDPAWDLALDDGGYVRALATAPDGSVYVGGDFETAGGFVRKGVAKVDSSGSVDPNWNLDTNYVGALSMASDGWLYVGGSFQIPGVLGTNKLIRVEAGDSGAIDLAWLPSVNDPVEGIVLDPPAHIFIRGGFTVVDAVPRRQLARISTTGGGVDVRWNPVTAGSVNDMAIQGDTLHVGGTFEQMGGEPRNGFAALPTALKTHATTIEIVTVSPSDAVVGEPYRVDFSVASASGGVPSGHVVVADGAGSHCGPVELIDGSGACMLTSTSAGEREVTATYTPDTTAFAASTATAQIVIAEAATELVIASHSPHPSIPLQPVDVDVVLTVVSPGSGTPVGGISITDGVDACTIPEGGTTCRIALSTRGPRTLAATYPGDGNFGSSSAHAVHHVNRIPVVGDSTYIVLEDGLLDLDSTLGVLANADDPDDDALTVLNAGKFDAAGIGGNVQLDSTGAFIYSPTPQASGKAVFDYVVGDGLEEVTASATIVVEPVNDAPTFSLASVPAWPAGESGAKQQPGFASVAAFGPPDEAGQHVQAWSVRTITDPAGVASSVAISNDGTLSYTLSGNAGSATFGVTLQDDGGIANGGDDTSVEQVFTIMVAAGLDLSVAIDDDRDFAQGGGTVEYTIVVHNAGPNAAVGARVRSLLPFNLVEPVWACTPDAGASCTAEGVGGIDDSVTIPMGASLIYVLGATVLADPETPIESSVSVLAPDGVPDADGTNNSAMDVDAVGIFADGFGEDDATLH